MIIRTIQPEDNQAIQKIIQNSLKSHGLAIPGSAYFDPELGKLSEYYASKPNAAYWVVVVDDKVMGGGGVASFSEDGRIAELQKLYLAPDILGQGISNQLMDTALEFASKHYDAIYLETMHQLNVACRLYEKYDFQLLDAPLEGSVHSAMDAWYYKTL